MYGIRGYRAHRENGARPVVRLRKPTKNGVRFEFEKSRLDALFFHKSRYFPRIETMEKAQPGRVGRGRSCFSGRVGRRPAIPEKLHITGSNWDWLPDRATLGPGAAVSAGSKSSNNVRKRYFAEGFRAGEGSHSIPRGPRPVPRRRSPMAASPGRRPALRQARCPRPSGRDWHKGMRKASRPDDSRQTAA